MTDPNELTSLPHRQDEAHQNGEYAYLDSQEMAARFALIGGFANGLSCGAVLDAGCGTGSLRRFLARDVSYDGVDVSGFAITKAKSDYSQTPNTRFFQSSLSDFKSDKTYDLAVWAGIGMGMTDPAQKTDASWAATVDFLFGLLNPTGYLILESIEEYAPRIENIVKPDCILSKTNFQCDCNAPYPSRSLLVIRNR